MTLHRRGLTRERLLNELAVELASEERAGMVAALVGDGDARTRLERALEAICELKEEDLDLFAAIAAADRDAIWHEDGDEALTRDEFVAPLRRLLVDGAADGSLRAVDDPSELATVLYNQVSWTYRHLRSSHRWNAERARAAVVRLAIDGAGT